MGVNAKKERNQTQRRGLLAFGAFGCLGARDLPDAYLFSLIGKEAWRSLLFDITKS
jgi:hypothetical protein